MQTISVFCILYAHVNVSLNAKDVTRPNEQEGSRRIQDSNGWVANPNQFTKAEVLSLPIGSIVVPFREYLVGSQI